MRIAVDMDNTLVDELGRELRPGIHEFLRALVADGHKLVLWTSSTGARARAILAAHGLAPYFAGFIFREDYAKDQAGAPKDIRARGLDALIDDDPQLVEYVALSGAQGILISTFRGGPADPNELPRIRARLAVRPDGMFAGLRRAVGLG